MTRMRRFCCGNQGIKNIGFQRGGFEAISQRKPYGPILVVEKGIVEFQRAKGDGDVTTGNFCEVHQRPLVTGPAEMRYGLLDPPKDYDLIKKEKFPHSNFYVSGGCSVGAGKKATVEFCPECRYYEDDYRLKRASLVESDL